MANLLTDLVLTSDDTFGGTFADILGMSDTVSIVGTSSVVILMTSNVPANKVDAGDVCPEYRFTVDGSPVGPELSAFHDTDSEFSGREVIFAVDGLSAGNHDFAVQARNRSGTAGTDTTRNRTFQVLEIPTGASLLVDLASVAADSAPVSWANVAGLSGSATPQAGSILLMLTGATLEANGGDEAADFRFAIDGARDGPRLIAQDDSGDETDSLSMAWAESGVSAASHTFSLQWQIIVSGPAMAEDRTRVLQVIEFAQDAELLVDNQSVASDTAPGSYANMGGMSGSPDIDSVDSVALVLANFVQESDTDTDERVESRLSIGAGGFEGAEQAQFKDETGRTASTLMARGVTGENGVTAMAMQWQIGKESPTADTTRERTFQVIELVAGGIQASGSPSITKPTSTGNAIIKKLASGAPSITKPTSTGNAIRKIVASGAPSINKPTSQGNAIVKVAIIASGAPSITKPTSQGNAFVCRQASGAPSITKPTSTGNAIVIPIIPPDEEGSTVHKYGREEQIRKRLEIEDEENLAIVIAATTAIFDELD